MHTYIYTYIYHVLNMEKFTCIFSAIFMVICDSPVDITHVPDQSYKH